MDAVTEYSRQHSNENHAAYMSRVVGYHITFAADKLFPEHALTRKQTENLRLDLALNDSILDRFHGITPETISERQLEGKPVRSLIERQMERIGEVTSFYNIAEQTEGLVSPKLDMLNRVMAAYQVLLCNEAIVELPRNKWRQGSDIVIIDREGKQGAKLGSVRYDPVVDTAFCPQDATTLSEDEIAEEERKDCSMIYYVNNLSRNVNTSFLVLYIMRKFFPPTTQDS